MGIRQEAFRFNGPGKSGAAAGDVIVDGPAPTYRQELATAVFCGVFPGDGWSARLEDAVLNGCIPVVVQVGALYASTVSTRKTTVPV